MKLRIILIALSVWCVHAVIAQEIPLGTWRTHSSYTNVRHLAAADNRIFAAVSSGIFYYDPVDNSINRLTRLDGLQGGGISAIAYDETAGVLVIGYATGNVDLFDGREIRNLDLISDSQVIGSKAINDILMYGEFAYLATDYGVLKLSAGAGEVRETYREIGDQGTQLQVRALSVFNDSLFVVSSAGIRAGSLDPDVNLADWRFWVDRPLPGNQAVDIAAAGSSLFAAVNNEGIYRYQNVWENAGLDPASGYARLHGATGSLTIVAAAGAEARSPADLSLIDRPESNLIMALQDALLADGTWWLADAVNGLVSNAGGNFASYSPSGPASANVFRMRNLMDSLYVLTGGFSGAVTPLNRETGVHIFSKGEWKNVYGQNSLLPFNDFTDVAVMPGTGDQYYASAGDGLLRRSGSGVVEIIDENSAGSPLVNPDAPQRGLIIPGLAAGTDGIWMINYKAATPVHRLAPDGTWTSFTVPVPQARFAVQIELIGNLVWLRIAPSGGGGLVVFRPDTGEARYLSRQPDNGNLPSLQVNTMVLDKDGFLWLGTDAGVSVITNPFSMEGSINAVEPVFDGRPLLIDEDVTTIFVDGGNRKWMGTRNGAWLFDPGADELLLRFTTAGSPLPDDHVLDIEGIAPTGEIFFGTPAGLVSFRADATEAGREHRDVRIFPNPVRRDFQGLVGISGLAGDAEVKITDSSGRLIFRTRANGGTASWNINAENLQSGIYMVFSATPDGQETYVGKIAVIR